MLGSGGSERAGRAPGVLPARSEEPDSPSQLPALRGDGGTRRGFGQGRAVAFPSLPASSPWLLPRHRLEHAGAPAGAVLGGFCSDLKMFGFGFFCSAVGQQLCWVCAGARQTWQCRDLRKMNPHYLLKCISETTLNPQEIRLIPDFKCS